MTENNQFKKNIVILGCTGMLGNVFQRIAPQYKDFSFHLIYRNPNLLEPKILSNLPINCSFVSFDTIWSRNRLEHLIQTLPSDRTTFVNCIGVTKQKICEVSAESVIYTNSAFPRILSYLLQLRNSRLIHISTDCVFDGHLGLYEQTHCPNAEDLYGMSKYLGESLHSTHLTIRTSIIGHEKNGNQSLLDWFLGHSDGEAVKGYRNAWFSGVTTLELARIILDIVIPDEGLSGLYHVSADRVNKSNLLCNINAIYDRNITVIPDFEVCIDRSLDSTPFRSRARYEPPPWSSMLSDLRDLYFPVKS